MTKMEDLNLSQVSLDEIILIFKRNAIKISEKKLLFKAIEQSKNMMNKMPVETLEDNLLCYLMPCMKKYFFELYSENSKINTIELSQMLSENLKILITLTDFIGNIIELVSLGLKSESISTFKVTLLELLWCFQATYNHCKESQKKYQTLVEDYRDILELYKKNQDFLMKFLDTLNDINVNVDNPDDANTLTQVLQSILNIMEILFGINIKALADTWKIYISIVEKHHEILINQAVYCVQEIQILIQQICSFMSNALENGENEKRRIQYIKLSGFLLKVGIKIITHFWEHLQIKFFELIHSFLSIIYNYSLEFLATWKLPIDVQLCIQTSLSGVLSPFVVEKILCESYLSQLLGNLDKLTKRGPGCMILDLKILTFLVNQPSNTVDYVAFSCLLNHIFEDASEHCMFFCETSTKTEDTLFVKFCRMISKCVENHSNFYDGDLEKSLFVNIVGSNLWCHFLACEVWIRILCIATLDSRREVTEQLISAIDKLNMDVSFSFPKSILLSRFMEKLFSILNENDISNILTIYPPQDHLRLWMLVGFRHISINQKKWIDPLLSSFISKLDIIEGIGSADEMIEAVEMLTLFSTSNYSVLGSDGEILITLMQKLWELSYENMNPENNFLKFFINKLSLATSGFMKYLSRDQIICVLKKMKALSTTVYFKVQVCSLLNAISTRNMKHSAEQNKMNFLISDLFEILLTENNELVKELSLEAFQQFSRHNQYIIVNNVSRLLPDMNLEQYLEKNADNSEMIERLRKLEVAPLEHKCFRKSYAKVLDKISKIDSALEQNNKAPVYQVPGTSKRSVLGYSRGIRPMQHKRIKLNDDVEENDDSVNEVLQRIKSEIKCLKTILAKDSLTKKNERDIKMLIGQLQNTVGSV